MTPTPQWVNVLSALLTPTIAIAGALIAWLQWRTARQKLALDLFDRRLKVVADLKAAIANVLREDKVDLQGVFAFLRAKDDAVYLFGSDVTILLDATYKRIKDLRVISARNSRSLVIDDVKSLDREFEILNELGSFFEKLEILIRPYLHIHTKV